MALAQSCTRFWGFIGLPAFPSLVRYVFLLPSLFVLSGSGFHGSLGVGAFLVPCSLFSSPPLVLGLEFSRAYCDCEELLFGLRVVRACMAEILVYSFDLPFPRLTMRTPLGLSRPPVQRKGGSSSEEPDLGQTGEGSGRLAIVVNQVPLAGPPSPFDKGKSKVSEIRYPGGFDYLRVSVQNAKAVGPSRIKPFFGKSFAARYRAPFGVHVWCLDFLTSYIFQVLKMV